MNTPRATSTGTMSIRQIAAIAAPNLVPIIGVYFFGWSAPNLLILYSLDTILSIGAMGALGNIYGRASRDNSGPTGLRGRLNWASGIAFIFAIALVLSIPFGVWIFLLLAPFGWSATDAIADHAFVRGALIQTAMALVAYVHGYRTLAGRDDTDRLLKQRMTFILARYAVTILAGIAGLNFFGMFSRELGGELQGFLLVGVYLGSSTYFELFPGLVSVFERGTPGSSERAPVVSRGSLNASEAASANSTAGPGLVITGFVIGALLVAWGGRQLWNTVGLSAHGVHGPGTVAGRWVIPAGLLVVGLWFLYRASCLIRRRPG